MDRQHKLLAGIAVVATLLAANAYAAEHIFGLWATPKGNGRVVIESCGDAVCGRLVDADQLRANPGQTDVNNPDEHLRSRLLKGILILQGYHGGPEEWSGGTAYSPKSGALVTTSTLKLVAPDKLEVHGCRWVLCRTETWIRIGAAAQ